MFLCKARVFYADRFEQVLAGDGWPLAFWDEGMRTDRMRKGRACLAPEVNRAYTFGKAGNSQTGGQFWKQFLQPIRLNGEAVPWTDRLKDDEIGSVAGLGRETYDRELRAVLKRSSDQSVDQVLRLESGGPNSGSISSGDDSSEKGGVEDWRIVYTSEQDYLAKARRLGLMHEFKEGRPRGSYCGVTTFWRGARRVHLVSTKTMAWAQQNPEQAFCS